MAISFNKAEFARLIGKSPRWITKLITEEGLPVESGGGKGKPVIIDSEIAINWLIKEAVAKAVGMREGDDDEPREGTKSSEDLLLTRAKRRKADVEASEAEKKSIKIEDFAQFGYAIATLYGNELTGLGARIGQDVALEDDPVKCKHIIDTETRRIRTATADALNSFAARCRGTDGEHDGGTAE